VWQDFGGGATGVALVRSCEKLPPCLTEPDGSKMDLPLAKAKPVSNGGSVSVIVYLKGGEKPCVMVIAAGTEE